MNGILERHGQPHVTSTQFREIIEGIVGTGSFITGVNEGLEAELVGGNVLRIKSGVLIHHGNALEIPYGTYEDFTYSNASQGMKKIDVIVARTTKDAGTGVESSTLVLVSGQESSSQPAFPSITEGNIQHGDLVDECALYAIVHDGISNVSIERVVDFCGSLGEIKAVLDGLDHEGSSSVTLTSGSTSGTLTLSKKGKLVNFTFEMIGSAAGANTSLSLGSIPYEFRPAVKQVRTINLYNSNVPAGIARIIFRETGVVEMVSNTTEFKEYIFSGCWMTN